MTGLVSGSRCRRPAKVGGLCAQHEAGRVRGEAREAKEAAERARVRALLAARDEVVRAAVALVTARYSEIGMSPDKNDMALFDAVAALARLEAK